MIKTYLSAEWADVFSSLGDFELFDDFPERSTISASVLSADSYLLCSLCHYYLIFNNKPATGVPPDFDTTIFSVSIKI